MAAALPIIVRLKMAAAAKADFGLDMLVAPEFEQHAQRQPVGQLRSFRTARDKMPHNEEPLRAATARTILISCSGDVVARRNINVNFFVVDLRLLDAAAGASSDLRNVEKPTAFCAVVPVLNPNLFGAAVCG